MIRKNDKDLLIWINEHVIDIADESNEFGLSWDSTFEEATKFLSSIPRKEKVQKYGIYATRLHYYVVDEFYDLKKGIEGGYFSENTCKIIYKWNKKAGRENWDMNDVYSVLFD